MNGILKWFHVSFKKLRIILDLKSFTSTKPSTPKQSKYRNQKPMVSGFYPTQKPTPIKINLLITCTLQKQSKSRKKKNGRPAGIHLPSPTDPPSKHQWCVAASNLRSKYLTSPARPRSCKGMQRPHGQITSATTELCHVRVSRKEVQQKQQPKNRVMIFFRHMVQFEKNIYDVF